MSAPPRASITGHRGHNLALLALLVVELAVLGVLSPHFVSLESFANTLRLASELAIVSLGMMLVVLVGGIDLSVGALLALSAVLLGRSLAAGLPPVLAVALAIMGGAAAGAINGVVVAWARIPAIIVTLGTMAIFRGLALGISGGESFAIPESLQAVAQANVAGLPLSFVVFLALACTAAWVLRRTRAGVVLYAVGHNETAARFAGLRAARAKAFVYLVAGALSALGGVLFAARVSSAKADFGVGLELDAITIVVLSGASLAGGTANVPGLALGIVIVGALRMGLTMVFVPAETQAILIGLVLIAAVAAGRLTGAVRRLLPSWAPSQRTADVVPVPESVPFTHNRRR
jgi:rhamnose transport system permease protein